MPRTGQPTQAQPTLPAWPTPRIRLATDDGSITLEFVILMPALLLLLFGCVQGAFWYHARNLALTAATEGLQTARTQQGTATAGERSAASFLARAGGLDGSTVAVDKTATTVTVTVTGSAPSILPGLLDLSVSQTAAGTVERFTTGDAP